MSQIIIHMNQYVAKNKLMQQHIQWVPAEPCSGPATILDTGKPQCTHQNKAKKSLPACSWHSSGIHPASHMGGQKKDMIPILTTQNSRWREPYAF